jgi:Tol biopolymer transport system component
LKDITDMCRLSPLLALVEEIFMLLRHALGIVSLGITLGAIATPVSAETDGTDCGCTATGSYLLPDPGVRPAVGTIDANFSIITSPGGKYRLERQGSNPSDPWRVVRVSNGAVLHPGIVANNFTWSPDDDRLATNRQDASALQYFSLWDLAAPGGAEEIWSMNGIVWASARRRFSDDGSSYLFAGARNGNEITINVVDVSTRALHATTFPVGTLPSDIDVDLLEKFGAPSSPSIAGWGWGPDATRFVYSWRTGTSPDEFAQTLVNVRTAAAATRYQNYPSAKWGFSPCGDVFGIVYRELFTQQDASALLYETFSPSMNPLTGPAAFAFDTVELGTNADDHFGLLGGIETPILSNDADDACSSVNSAPAASFTPPANPIAGQPATFTDTSTDSDGAVVSRSWDFGDGGSSTARDPSHVFTQPGTYTVTLTVTDDDGATDTVEQVVRVCGAITAMPGKLLHAAGGTLGSDLFAFDTSSLATARLTFQSGPNDYESRWSPDGTRVAFSHSDFLGSGIYTMNADGSDRRQLTFGSRGDFDDHLFPAWTPDGEWIAFQNQREGVGTIGPLGIYMVRKDGTELVRVPGTTNADRMEDVRPEIEESCVGLPPAQRTPECYTLVFTRGYASLLTDIRQIRGDGSGSRVLIGASGLSYDARVSPDGTRLAYVSREGQGPKGALYSIFVADLTTDPVVQPSSPVVTGGDGQNEHPVWSPDGSMLAFTRAVIPSAGSPVTDRDVWLTDAGGCTQQSLLAQPGVFEYSLDWATGSAAQAPGSVSGRVLTRPIDVQGPTVPVAGAIVELVGDGPPRTTTTDADGRYEFTGITIGANVTVRFVSAPNWVGETPPYDLVGLTGGSANRNFYGLPDVATVSGVILEDLGFGATTFLSGVTVRVEGPGGPYQAVTDANGRWSVPAARYRQIYTATPERAGYRFDPPSRTFETYSPTTIGIDFGAHLLPPEGFVAFTSVRDGNNEIYVSELDGGYERNLTNTPSSDVEPAVSPDGARIAFASDRDGSWRIYTTDLTGFDVQPVESAAGSGTPLEGREPAWSFDGTQLAVATPFGLRIVRFDGAPPQAVTSDPHDASPAFDASGTRLHFERAVDDGFGVLVRVDLYEVDLSQSPPVETLVASGGPDTFSGDPAANPDGTALAYTSDDIYWGNGDIVVLDGTGAIAAQIYGREPSWSPDGQHLVGVRADALSYLFWSTADGLRSQVFTTSGADREPSWGPGSLAPQCGNGTDDDGDGLTDLDDPSCGDESGPSERVYGPCDDTLDDDGDGLAAFPQDPGCADAYDFDERSATLVCDNGLDDDGDGLADMADRGCPVPYASLEDPLCDNGADDDGNGLVDRDDPKCQAGWPYWERTPACGFGGEIALALGAVAAVRRRVAPSAAA